MNITIIGGGNMGEALIKGLKGQKLIVCEADLKRAVFLRKKYKVRLLDIPSAVHESKIVILAVKPQDMMSALVQMADTKGKLFISIAAGLTTAFFEQNIGDHPAVVRAMPNMPALIGQGITGLCAGKYATAADMKMAQKILSAVGQSVIVKENMMDAITAVSGSGPAYVFLFVEQWMSAAKVLGFSDKDAKDLVYKTLIGSANLLVNSEEDAGHLRHKVTSKGGTTQAAMDVFMHHKTDQVFKQALAAAKNRAKELAK